VYKFIIGRPITFADYAYFDPEVHESLSRLCQQAAKKAQNDPSLLDADTEMMFEWDESVGIKGGTAPVTWRNVKRWCQRKARYEMLDRVLPELTALRAGVHGACTPMLLAPHAAV
jgi:hypothetical protein